MRKTGLRPAWQREQSDTRGWLLYDGACGFCAHWVMRFEWALRRRGIATVPLQEEWVRDLVPLSEAELMKDITLVLAEGGVLRLPVVAAPILVDLPAGGAGFGPICSTAFRRVLSLVCGASPCPNGFLFDHEKTTSGPGLNPEMKAAIRFRYRVAEPVMAHMRRRRSKNL